MRFIGLLVVLLLSGCGKGLPLTPVDRGEFQKYWEKFEAYSKEQGRLPDGKDLTVEVRFGDTGSDKNFGLCRTSFFSRPEVLIDEKKFAKLKESSRESLLNHEFGHCILGRKHTTEKRDGRPKSLMNPTFVPGEVYEKHKEEYLDELFNS